VIRHWYADPNPVAKLNDGRWARSDESHGNVQVLEGELLPEAVFRIRIRFMRIRIQPKKLNADLDPCLDKLE
jgi:hypothetical protein